MIKSKHKKKLVDKYHELTFANEHVDTFYKGLNDDYKNQAENPLQAKVININEDGDLLKDWVKPDSQLTKNFKNSTLLLSNKKVAKSHLNASERSPPRKRNSNRYKALKFVKPNRKSKEGVENNDLIIAENPIEIINEKKIENKENNIILFESSDEDERRVCDTQKIIAPDTPIEHYNTSVIQRRRLGLPF